MVRILLTGYSSRSSVIIGLNFQQIGKNPGFSSRPVIFRKNPGVSPTSRGNPGFAFGPEKFVGSRRLGYTYCFKWCKHVWERLKDRPKRSQKYISALISSISFHAAQWSFYSRDFNHRSRQVISQRLWDLGSVTLGPSHSEPRSLRVLRSIRRRPGHLFHLLISPHIPRLQSWGFFGLKTPSYISYSTGFWLCI